MVFRLLRTVLGVCLVLAALAPRPALAHGGSISALVTMTPAKPAPGQDVVVKASLLDVYSSKIAGMKVRMVVGAIAQPLPTPTAFTEGPDGVYTGHLTFPPAGPALLGLEAVLPDGLYHAEIPLQVGDGQLAVNGLMMQLLHEDAGLCNTPAGGAPNVGAPNAATTSAAAPGSFTFSLTSALLGAGVTAILCGLFLLRRR